MSNKNLLNRFKQFLGEYCAINQFIELSKRSLILDHNEEINNREKFVTFAKNNSISLTNYDANKMINVISLSYIVNVHLCFETFLIGIYEQSKLYGQFQVIAKSKEDSWLDCALKNIYNGNPPKNIRPLSDICNYYRLIRNSAVHDLANIDSHYNEYEQLSKYQFDTFSKFRKLSAPNKFEYISFDDFVMFSRSANELATTLYSNLCYDYEKIVSTIDIAQFAKFKNHSNDLERCENSLYMFLKTEFKDSIELKSQVQKFLVLLWLACLMVKTSPFISTFCFKVCL